MNDTNSYSSEPYELISENEKIFKTLFTIEELNHQEIHTIKKKDCIYSISNDKEDRTFLKSFEVIQRYLQVLNRIRFNNMSKTHMEAYSKKYFFP